MGIILGIAIITINNFNIFTDMKPTNIIFDLGGVIFGYDQTMPNPNFYPLIPGLHILKKCASQKDQFGKKLHRIYILSNWSKTSFDRIKAQYPDIMELFDGYIISGEVGYSKPEEEIFKLLIDRYHLEGERCIFIDDTQAHILTANRLGWTSILYDDATDTETLLAKLGIF